MAVAPVAPAVSEIVVSLALFAAFLIAFGLLQVYRSTLSKILTGLADAIDGLKVHIPHVATIRLFAPLAAVLRYTDAQIDSALGWAVLNTQRGGLLLFRLAAHQIDRIGRTIGGLAFDVEQRFARMAAVTIPAATAAAAARVSHRVAAVEADLATLGGRFTRTIDRRIHALRATAEAELARLRVGIDRVERTIGRELQRDVAAVAGSIGLLDRQFGSVRARVRGLERAVSKAGAAALVAGAIATLGLKWLRCAKVGRVGKRVCGMDYDLLESMVADTLIIAGTISLVEFARGMEEVTAEVAPLVRRFWRAT